MIVTPATVPELDVSDIRTSLDFYVALLGFKVAAERPEEAFAYLVRGDVHLMLEAAEGPGRRFRTAPLEKPFGRGLNLQLRVDDIAALRAALAARSYPVVLDIEDRWYRQGDVERGARQFVVADPDGYLLRFFQDLGARRAVR